MADETTLTEIVGNEALTADLSEAQVLVMRGLKGDTGEKGDKGDTGATGAAGAKGDKGDKGDRGESLHVNSAGHVTYWDEELQQWVDTGIEVEGVPGPEGPEGPAGEDGVSPAVTITTITGGHRITITDEAHPDGQSFDVMDGEDGDSSGARLLYYSPALGKMQWYEHPGDESLQEITGEGVSDLVLEDGFAVFAYEPGIQRVYQLTQLPDNNGRLAIFVSDGNPKLKLTMNWQNSAVTKTDITEQKQVRFYRHYTAASGIFSEHEIAYEDNGSVLTADGEDIYNAIQSGIYPVIVDYGTSYPRIYKPEMVLNGTMIVFRSTDVNGSVAGLSLGWSDSIAVPFTAIGDMPMPNAQTDVGKVPTVNSSGGYTLQTPSSGGSETFTIHLTGNATDGYAITESAAEIMAHYPNLVLVYDDVFVDNYYLVGARLVEEAMWGYLWFAQDQNWATDGTVSRSFVDLSIVWDTESPNYGVIAYRSSTNLRKLPQATSAQNGKILGVVNGDYALVNASGGADIPDLGVEYESLEWQAGKRYNMQTGEIESRAQSQSIGKFTLQNGRYRITDAVHGTLHYFDLLEWDENGEFVGNRETNSLETFIEFCPNPRHLYALNINDTRNLPENIRLVKMDAEIGAELSVTLDGNVWEQDSSQNVYVDLTAEIAAAFPDATYADVLGQIGRCNHTLIVNTAQSGSYTMPGLDGGASFSLNYGNGVWYLKLNNSNNLAGVQAYFGEHPNTLTINGADQTHYLRQKLDYTKDLAEENAERIDDIQVNTPRVAMAATDTTATIQPNKLYVFPEMASLAITLATPTDSAIVNEYHFIFTSGATATTLTLPATINQPDVFTVEANHVYEVSILEGNMTAQGWAVTA